MRPPTPDEIAALRRHPRFGEASTRLIAGLTGYYRGNRVLNRVLNDRGRALMGLLILDLHYNGAAEGGLTATRLARICVETGVCSKGRVTAMLGILRLFGFLVEAPSSDGRTRRLAPTEKLLAAHRARWRHFLEALAVVSPDGRAALGRLEDPGFVAAQVGAMGAMYRAGMRVIGYVPELSRIVSRDAGVMVVLTLVREARRVGRAPHEPLDVTISALAGRFSVSRGHVLSILRDAEREGLIERSGPRGEGIALRPALLDAADRFAAAGMLIHAVSVRTALGAGPVSR